MIIVRHLIPIFRFVVLIAIKELLHSIISSSLSLGTFLKGGALVLYSRGRGLAMVIERGKLIT
jgi:hypothetical protein